MTTKLIGTDEALLDSVLAESAEDDEVKIAARSFLLTGDGGAFVPPKYQPMKDGHGFYVIPDLTHTGRVARLVNAYWEARDASQREEREETNMKRDTLPGPCDVFETFLKERIDASNPEANAIIGIAQAKFYGSHYDRLEEEIDPGPFPDYEPGQRGVLHRLLSEEAEEEGKALAKEFIAAHPEAVKPYRPE